MQVRIQKPVESRRPAGPHGDASLSSTRRAIVSRLQRCLPLAGEGRRNASAQVALWGMTSPKIRNAPQTEFLLPDGSGAIAADQSVAFTP
jgi:hypothetical protein